MNKYEMSVLIVAILFGSLALRSCMYTTSYDNCVRSGQDAKACAEILKNE